MRDDPPPSNTFESEVFYQDPKMLFQKLLKKVGSDLVMYVILLFTSSDLGRK